MTDNLSSGDLVYLQHPHADDVAVFDQFEIDGCHLAKFFANDSVATYIQTKSYQVENKYGFSVKASSDQVIIDNKIFWIKSGFIKKL